MQEPMPRFLTDLMPDALREYALFVTAGGACIASVIVLLLLYTAVRFLFAARPAPNVPEPSLRENLAEYPELTKTSGDRQLRAEGVPVRLRFVAVAPAGTMSEVDVDHLADMLERILPGLGEIYKYDRPRVKVWPTQVSFQGFGNHFHQCMVTGLENGEPTRWALIAGRVRFGKQQIMLGVALQSTKPNTIGRRTIDTHEWTSILRVRVKE